MDTSKFLVILNNIAQTLSILPNIVKSITVNIILDTDEDRYYQMLLDIIICIMMPQVHDGDCYLLALDLLQQHAATLGAAAIAVTCLMVSSLPIMMFMNMCLMLVSFL